MFSPWWASWLATLCKVRLFWLVPAVLLIGCEKPTELGGSYEVRDSAGVRVVINRTPAWPGGSGWTVEARPEYTIGELSGDLPYTFERIRDVGQTPDGRIYVSDQGAFQIRFFDRDGDWITSVGREGEGPGELGWIWSAGPYRGDSIWVYDYQHRQVSVFGPRPEHQFARRIRNEYEPHENYWVRGVFEDGSFLLVSPGHTMMAGPVGLRDDSTHVLAMHPGGAPVDTLTAVRITKKYIDPDGRGHRVEMAPHLSLRSAGNELFVAEGAAPAFRVYGRAGTLKEVVVRDWTPRLVTPERRRQYVDAHVENLELRGLREGSIEEARRRREEAEHWAESVPSVGDLLVDETGHVWLGRYVSLGVPPTQWEVFDPDGRWLGTVHTPGDLEVMTIGADLVLGVHVGEYGVEFVRAHRLIRSY